MKKSRWKTVGWYLFLLLFVLSLAALAQALMLGVLPMKYLAVVVAGVAVMDLFLYFMLNSRRVNRVNRVLGSILALLLCAALVVGNLYVFKTNSAFDAITHDGQQRHELSVVVKVNSQIDAIQQISTPIAVTSSMDESRITGFKENVKEKADLDVQVETCDSLMDMVKALYDDQNEAILLDESYRSLINDEEEYQNFDNETKVIYTYVYYTEDKTSTKNVDVTNDSFTVLVSGIDTYGSITTISRSDVNMLVTVNPNTKNIQLVSIPRDFYVETDCDASYGCGIGEMDKLTHTGLHGVQTTKATLEKLFGIDINYTLRVNFSSVENIVNALGGITVDNTDGYAFSIGGYDFTQSVMELNGEQALAFSRERHSFAEGDRERGRNQMRVIRGMINKATSPAVLTNYMSFLDAISDSFETDMSTSEMKALIQMQLDEGGSWNIGSISVNGTGGSDYCYELGNYAYVMYPDMDTVNAAVTAIENVINGGEVTNG